MKSNILKIIVLTTLLSVNAYSQLRTSPKKLKFKEEFTHSETNSKFPKAFGDLKIVEVNSFDRKDKNVGVTYENNTTKLNIYIYPDEVATEGRLRDEFMGVYSVIFNKEFNGDKVSVLTQKGDKYTYHGLRTMESINGKNEFLTIFECGTWLVKLRISSIDLNEEALINLEKLIVAQIDPSRLTGLKLFNLQGKISLSKSAFQDSTWLASTMVYTFKKFAWLRENLSEDERYSGFQDLYVEMHKEALAKFLEFGIMDTYPSTSGTKEYLRNLQTILESKYLTEFLLEQYNMILIVPKDVILNFAEYHKWKTEIDFHFNLRHDLSQGRYEI